MKEQAEPYTIFACRKLRLILVACWATKELYRTANFRTYAKVKNIYPFTIIRQTKQIISGSNIRTLATKFLKLEWSNTGQHTVYPKMKDGRVFVLSSIMSFLSKTNFEILGSIITVDPSSS